jgi:hypothetical protein
LIERGFESEDLRTTEIISRWHEADPSLLTWGNSAAHLRRANRAGDVDFAITHYDDLPIVCRAQESEVKVVETSSRSEQASVNLHSSENAGLLRARKNPLRIIS